MKSRRFYDQDGLPLVPKQSCLKKIAKYFNDTNVLSVNSWTAGAELLLYWYGIKEGNALIMPVYNYCATANVVIQLGAKVIMVDVTLDFKIDISKIEKHITSRTKAIIPVDVGGLPIDREQRIQTLKRGQIFTKKIILYIS